MSEELTAPIEQEVAEQAARASELEAKIKQHKRNIEHEWVLLAERLYHFVALKGWEKLGYESLNLWLASPEIEFSRGHALDLVSAYRTLVIDGGIKPDDLTGLGSGKVRMVLPAVRRKQVEPAKAVADIESLAFSDLREEYSSLGAIDSEPRPIVPDDFHWEVCDACGSKYKVAD